MRLITVRLHFAGRYALAYLQMSKMVQISERLFINSVANLPDYSCLTDFSCISLFQLSVINLVVILFYSFCSQFSKIYLFSTFLPGGVIPHYLDCPFSDRLTTTTLSFESPSQTISEL